MKTLRERFEEKYIPEPNSGCFIWVGSIGRDGYGKMGDGPHTLAAHRVSWGLNKGKIPSGQNVLHKCDVRRCVNHEHLFLGTKKDNTQDMIKKRRRYPTHGLHNGNAKLNDLAVIEIRNSPETGAALAEKFGVSDNIVSCVRLGKTWRHVP